MADRFVIFTKPRVRDHDGQIYAMVWDRKLHFITKGTGRNTPAANADAIAKAKTRAYGVEAIVLDFFGQDKANV